MPRRATELGRLVHNVRTFGIRAPINEVVASESALNPQTSARIESGDALSSENLTAIIVANVDGLAELAVRDTMKKADPTQVN